MLSIFFYLFVTMMISGALMVVLLRNPVSSALAMLLSFVGIAGVFTGLNAYFIGILQILVYAGAIIVLFIFIVMLLDIKKEEKTHRSAKAVLAGIFIPAILLFQIAGVITSTKSPSSATPELKLTEAAAHYKKDSVIAKKLNAGSLPDIHLIGRKLYTDYNFPLQMVAVLLLSATIGCVTLSKKSQPSKKSSK